MIEVTKLNRAKLVVNADMIEVVESTPDTLVTLTTGRKIMVRESIAELLSLVLAYRAKTRSYPVPVTADASGTTRERGRSRRRRSSD